MERLTAGDVPAQAASPEALQVILTTEEQEVDRNPNYRTADPNHNLMALPTHSTQ